jgi:hypothetical protein
MELRAVVASWPGQSLYAAPTALTTENANGEPCEFDDKDFRWELGRRLHRDVNVFG